MPENPAITYTCEDACEIPVFDYEDMTGLSEKDRLLFMRTGYQEAQDCLGFKLSDCPLTDDEKLVAEDRYAAVTQALITVNDALVDLEDGVPVTPAELMSTNLGDERDPLSDSTRRSTPLGTIVQELDTYKDNIPTEETDPIEEFEVDTEDDIEVPNFDDINYEESTEADAEEVQAIVRELIDFREDDNKDMYSESHKSCMDDMACTFDEIKAKPGQLPDLDYDENEVIDVEIDDEDITSGCANGDGLYDKLMTAIDSSIALQWKNSRLDAKTFGVFYAGAMSSAMQQTTAFLIQKEQLKLDAARLKIEADKQSLAEINQKYTTALLIAQTTKVILETAALQKSIPIDLAKLTQEAKLAEKSVELTTRQIEKQEADVVATYNTIAETRVTNGYERIRIKQSTQKISQDIEETTMNGKVTRDATIANTTKTRVDIKTAKFDAILRKYQAYASKVATEESKATGAANRRLTNADIQPKNKQASLYDQQRKTYIYGQRESVLKLMKDMWTIQIDTLGAEGMAIEAIKGPEMSSKLERAALDVGM